MIKNMFGGESKSKKDLKKLEDVLKTILSCTKEKIKNEACQKLIEIFENSLEININFDILLTAIDELSECKDISCKKIWLQLVIQIIKFRSDYRHRLSNKMLKIIFELKSDENLLKTKTLLVATNCCLDIQDPNIRHFTDFLTFECLLSEEFQQDYVFAMIQNILKNFSDKISKFLIEFIVDCLIIIGFKHINMMRDLTDPNQLDEQKKYMKSIFPILELYLSIPNEKKNSIIRNIVDIYCIFVYIDRDYSWKSIRSFLNIEPEKIMRNFLEIIHNDNISNTFTDLKEYTYYYNADDEEFGTPGYFKKIEFFETAHKTFMSKVDIKSLLIKHKSRKISGSCMFIGMTLWGYERIESIQIPYTIVLSHFSKWIYNSHSRIDQEIILCIRRLICKYGETLSDEWNEIFKIMSCIPKWDKSELLHKNFVRILDDIKILIVSKKFFGKISDYTQILDNLKYYENQNESLILTKIRLKLSTYCFFISNLESVIIEYLLNSKSERVKNYIIEIIRLNYTNSYSYNKKNVKINMIENLLFKHFTSLLFSFENQENLNLFSQLITDICLLTSDLKFFEKILNNIMMIHNQYKMYSNENDKFKYIFSFQKYTLINIYNKISNTFQSDKIICVNKKIYNLIKNKCDITLLMNLLNFFKNFNINKDYELILQNNHLGNYKNLPSSIVTNFKVQKTKKNKKVGYDNFKVKKINIYEPYIAFKHNKVYDLLMKLIVQDETNTFICEEVMEFLSIHLNTTYFFKGLKLERLLNVIVELDDIKKYATRKRFIDLIIEILINCSFHLNGGSLSKDSSSGFNSLNIGSNTKENKVVQETIIEINDEFLKEKILNFSINGIKSFMNIIKSMMNTYRKIVTSSITPQINSNKNSTTSLEQCTSSISINIVTENMDIYQTNNQTNTNVNFKIVVYYIKKFLNLISIYLSTFQDSIENLNVLINQKNIFNYYSGNNINLINSPNQSANKKLSELINTLIEILFDMRNLVLFKSSIAVSILFMIMNNKELFIQSGEDNIIKIIYLVLNIGWPNYENEISKYFTECFNIKNKKFENEKIRPQEKPIIKEYINFLADIVCLYFIEKSSQGRLLLNILNSIFKNNIFNNNQRSNSSTIRENIFLDLSKWQIHSKTNRDNILSEFKSRIPFYSQIYLGKQSIIMIVPVDSTTSHILVRNPISNLLMTVNTNLDQILNEDLDTVDILTKIINKKQDKKYTYDSLSPSAKAVNKELLFQTPKQKPGHKFSNSSMNINEISISEESEEFSLRNVSLIFSDLKQKPIREMSPKIKCKDFYLKGNSNNIIPELYKSNSDTNVIYSGVNNGEFKKEGSLHNDYIQNLTSGKYPFSYINNSNIILQQLTNLLGESDFKFQMIENSTLFEDYIKSIDNTPVYFTYNCGIIYIPTKQNLTEFDVLTYEGEVSKNYIKFLSSLGKIFTIADNPNIYTGGLNKTGINGKYAIFHQDNLFQLIFHIINLIKFESRSLEDKDKEKDKEYLINLSNVRKKIIGNDYVNIVWLENSYGEFDPSLIISSAILIYLVIYPISDTHYLIRLKHNSRSRFNLQEKISTYFTDDLCISIDNENISRYLIQTTIRLNIMISYILQKNIFKKIEHDRQINQNLSLSSGLPTKFYYETNILQRYREIERINFKFKNSTSI